MHFPTTTTTLLLILTALTPTFALPSTPLSEIERRWAAGDSEVLPCPLHSPGCYVYAWFQRYFCTARHERQDSVGSAWSPFPSINIFLLTKVYDAGVYTRSPHPPRRHARMARSEGRRCGDDVLACDG